MVTKDDACWIIGLSAGAGIGVYLDGGWGVDALVGRETRAHNDIDLFVQRGDYQRFVDLIADEGFSEVAASFTTEDHTVWQDEAGRIVDLHCFDFAENGDILYQGDRFPGEVFSGRGRIGEVEVSCIDPESQLLFHLGYQHDEHDAHDVMLLCREYGFDVPEEYRSLLLFASGHDFSACRRCAAPDRPGHHATPYMALRARESHFACLIQYS